MRIWPLTVLRARRQAARDARAIAAAADEQERERNAARQRLLNTSHHHHAKPTWNGPTQMLNAGPMLTYGQECGYRPRLGGWR